MPCTIWFLAFIIVMSVLNGTKGNNNSSYYRSDTNNSVITPSTFFCCFPILVSYSNYIATLLSPFNEWQHYQVCFRFFDWILYVVQLVVLFYEKKGKINKDERQCEHLSRNKEKIQHTTQKK